MRAIIPPPEVRSPYNLQRLPPAGIPSGLGLRLPLPASVPWLWLFALIPGPNLLAYYLAFRVIGHIQSWRGARHAMERTRWTLESDDHLAELAALVEQPREVRASRVAAIAEQLNLSRLSAFFDRVAVRSG